MKVVTRFRVESDLDTKQSAIDIFSVADRDNLNDVITAIRREYKCPLVIVRRARRGIRGMDVTIPAAVPQWSLGPASRGASSDRPQYAQEPHPVPPSVAL